MRILLDAFCSFLFFLVIIIVILWLNQIPLFLSLNGNFEGSVMVSLLIVANKCHAPEVVKSHGADDNVGVVSLVVMAHPGSDESPEALNSWISSESGHFLWLSSKNRSVPEVSWSKLGSEWSVILLVRVPDKMRHG